MPREIVAFSPEKLQIREYDLPDLQSGQVRVKSEFGAAKHGTELAFLKGYPRERGRYDPDLEVFVQEGGSDSSSAPGPARVGNMFVGRVAEIGPEVTGTSVGDRVLGYGPFREVHTVHTDRCWPMPDDLAWKSAVCLDPADFAMAAVRDGNLRVGDAVAIYGLGAIGLMAVQIAVLAGASPVIGVDPLSNRRVAAAACGADIVLDPNDGDVGYEIRTMTDPPGVDVAIEYSGSVEALQSAIRATGFGGTVVAGAFPAPYGPGLDLGAEAHANRPTIVFSRACSEPNRDHPRWTEKRIYATCWRLIVDGVLSGEHVVDPVVPFEDLITEFPRIATDPGSNVKLGAAFSAG